MSTTRCCINFPTFEDGTCVEECPGGTFETRQMADGTELGYCLPCDHACSTCNGASPRDCVTCSSAHLRLGGVCVTHCPTGYESVLLGFDFWSERSQTSSAPTNRLSLLSYYRDASHCERCDPSCELCSGPGRESCRTCLRPFLELQGTKLCVERCPQRFYQKGDLCKQCHTSCQTCAGTDI